MSLDLEHYLNGNWEEVTTKAMSKEQGAGKREKRKEKREKKKGRFFK